MSNPFANMVAGMLEKKRQAAIEAALPQAIEQKMNIATSIQLQRGALDVACILIAPGAQPPDGEWEIFETSRPIF